MEPRRAFLVWPRVLRRVITQDRQLAGLTIRLPHRKSYVIGREPLLEIVEPGELGLDAGQDVPERVILLPQPSDASLAETPGGAILALTTGGCCSTPGSTWSSTIDCAAGGSAAESVRQRIRQIGHAEFDEIRAVLAQEAFLLPPRDDMGVYCEFAAVYWELRYFAQPLLPRYFPAIEDFRLVEAVLGEDARRGRSLRGHAPARRGGPEDAGRRARPRGCGGNAEAEAVGRHGAGPACPARGLSPFDPPRAKPRPRWATWSARRSAGPGPSKPRRRSWPPRPAPL